MKSTNTIEAVLDALASQRQQGETSLIVTIKPDLIQDAMSALPGCRKVFAAVVPGVTDTAPIHAAYQRIQEGGDPGHTILLLVECRTTQQFSDAIGRLPVRKSSEWHTL